MAKKCTGKKQGDYSSLGVRPENRVEEYNEAALQEPFFLNPPSENIPCNKLEFLAVTANRDFLDACTKQKELLQIFKFKKEQEKKSIKKMYEIQSDLRSKFIELNNFLKDCEDKERMADQKIAAEKELHRNLRTNAAQIKDELGKLKDFVKELSLVNKQLEPYETVINEVIEKSEVYSSQKDLMDRCDALMLAQQEITELEKEKVNAIERINKEMIKASNDAASTVLGLNNELAELEKSYNNAKLESLKWEKILSTTKEFISDNEFTTDRIFDAVHQMYKSLCKRNKITPKASKNDLDTQFDYIRDEIQILEGVIKACEAEQEKTRTRK